MRRSSRRIRSNCRSSPKARALQQPRTRASHRPRRQLRARRRPARSTQQTTPRWERPGHTSRASLRLPRPPRATAARSHNPSCRSSAQSTVPKPRPSISPMSIRRTPRARARRSPTSSTSARSSTADRPRSPHRARRARTTFRSSSRSSSRRRRSCPRFLNRRTATAAVRTVEARAQEAAAGRHRRRSERGRDARRKRRRRSRLRRLLTATEGRDIRVHDQGSHGVELTFRVTYGNGAADRWTEAARSRAPGDGTDASGTAPFDPGPNATETYGSTLAGFSQRSVVFIDSGTSSTTVLIVTSPGIAAVLGASTTSEATGSDATEPREGRAGKSATSEGEAPGGHAPTCCRLRRLRNERRRVGLRRDRSARRPGLLSTPR